MTLPAADLIAIQYNGLLEYNTEVGLYDLQGRLLKNTQINKGQTVAYFNVETLYSGTYVVRIKNATMEEVRKIILAK